LTASGNRRIKGEIAIRDFAIFGTPQSAGEKHLAKVELEGVGIDCRIIETPDPDFEPGATASRAMVLVRKRGFSLNYRDRAFILGTALRSSAESFAVLGSEFAGEVVACGPEAHGLRPGDRVIANNAYPDSGVPGVLPGIPGNMLSKELQVVHAAKLAHIPDSMSDADAAGFSIGAQTTFSMVRKLALVPGAAVLVAGGRSNTTLFAINALKAHASDPPFDIYVSTTSERSERALRALGIADVIRIDPEAPSFTGDAAVQRVVRERGGFDAVIDPFFDIHLIPAVRVMKQGGRYVTCGLYNQTGHLVPHKRPDDLEKARGLMGQVMVNNLQIIGNCLGLTEDLDRALAAYSAKRFPVIVDSVFSDGDAAGFLDRTYNAPDRFGKVIYVYR
jgi:NADPH:quinone reductase-like Zn-dependent oxidoreductase